MDVEEESTVAALKRAIHESEQLGVGVSLSLILGHRKLDVDNLSLAEAGIEEGTTVIVVKHQLPAVLTASRDGTAKIWNASTGECTQTLCGHSGTVNSAVFSHDGSSVLTASEDATAKIWNASTGECTRTLSGHSGAVMSAVFSGDGSSVLTASHDRTAKIWSASTGECTQTLSGHSGWMTSAIFSTN